MAQATKALAASTFCVPAGIASDQAQSQHQRERFRGRGLGFQVMKESLKAVENRYGSTDIALSAQKYLEKFYKDLGFVPKGKAYLEDGIPHIRMVLQRNSST